MAGKKARANPNRKARFKRYADTQQTFRNTVRKLRKRLRTHPRDTSARKRYDEIVAQVPGLGREYSLVV